MWELKDEEEGRREGDETEEQRPVEVKRWRKWRKEKAVGAEEEERGETGG